jgi:C-terminal processing protease CtpA/Prc
MEKSAVVAPTFAVQGETIRLPLTEGTPEKLREAIRDKSTLTIDLRNNVNGDPNVMRQCLALLAPSGKYGTLTTERKEKPALLVTERGNDKAPQLTLLVDQTTSGAAEILALALSNHARAKLSGSQMAGDRTIRQIVQLPDGSGYTLVTSVYKPQVEQNTIVAQGGAR